MAILKPIYRNSADQTPPPPQINLPLCHIPAGGGVDSFWLSQTPITNAQYAAVISEHRFTAGEEDFPVVNVSWNDAWEFCDKAAQLLGVSVRLPNELEWCWAAGKEPDKLERYAVFNRKDIVQVATKIPNEYGLYDMRGLVWEWLDANDQGSQFKILRGGSWSNGNVFPRAVARNFGAVSDRSNNVGFRVVMTRPAVS
jgi:formylglycine-generating enzyme required for sulfatase activity